MAAHTVEWTVDLVCCIALALLVPVAVLVVGVESPLRAAITLPFLVFVPGYAFLATVYPERHEPSTKSRDATHALAAHRAQAGIPAGERLVLSVLISCALTPFVALLLNFTGAGVRPRPVLVAIAGLTLLLSVGAVARRARLSFERRGGVSFAAAASLFGGEGSSDGGISQSSTLVRALNVVVVLALLLVPVTAAFAFTEPTAGQQFTEFSVTGQNESGNYTVESLPTQLEPGTEEPVYVTIRNQEGAPESYTVVAMLQRTERTDDGVTVRSSRRLTSFERDLADGERARITHSLGPLDAGQRYRVAYLLYTGEAPTNPTRDNAYRSLRVWVTVTESGEQVLVGPEEHS